MDDELAKLILKQMNKMEEEIASLKQGVLAGGRIEKDKPVVKGLNTPDGVKSEIELSMAKVEKELPSFGHILCYLYKHDAWNRVFKNKGLDAIDREE